MLEFMTLPRTTLKVIGVFGTSLAPHASMPEISDPKGVTHG